MTKKELASALNYLNRARKVLGLMPLEEIPKGNVGETFHCPLANGFRAKTINDDKTLCKRFDFGVDGGLLIITPRKQPASDDTLKVANQIARDIAAAWRMGKEGWGAADGSYDEASVNLPSVMQEFVQQFDNGKVPGLEA